MLRESQKQTPKKYVRSVRMTSMNQKTFLQSKTKEADRFNQAFTKLEGKLQSYRNSGENSRNNSRNRLDSNIRKNSSVDIKAHGLMSLGQSSNGLLDLRRASWDKKPAHVPKTISKFDHLNDPEGQLRKMLTKGGGLALNQGRSSVQASHLEEVSRPLCLTERPAIDRKEDSVQKAYKAPNLTVKRESYLRLRARQKSFHNVWSSRVR